ncbi:MAG TPA: hypothetical protein VKB96_12545 [Gammaproteobacteria bacterium]|nr:hypothetical protein [Gammaproteobacteria bacterium]
MAYKLLPLAAVNAARRNEAKATTYQRINRGLLTKPVKLGRSSARVENEIQAINTAIKGASDDEIRQLVRELEAARTFTLQGAPMTSKQKAVALGENPCTRDCNKPARKHPATFIPIDEQHGIGADLHIWHTLKQHRYKSSHHWESIAWYATLEQCINGFANQTARLSCAQSLAELSAECQRVISLICRALPPHFNVAVRP